MAYFFWINIIIIRIETFPVQEQKPTILVTPDERGEIAQEQRDRIKQGGFHVEEQKPYREGFQAEERDWRDNILFSKKYVGEDGNQRYEDREGSRTFDPSADENHNGLKRDERYGKLYQDKDDDKVWWSKDKGGLNAHAGEHWKKFVQKGKKFIEVEEVDTTGKVMQKNLHGRGAELLIKDLIGIK